MINYYKILNIEFGATETEIKKAFRKLATIYHPDKNKGSKKSEELFKIILNAYEILSDKDKKAEYDKNYKEYFLKKETYQNNSKPKYEQNSRGTPKEKEKNKKTYKSTTINYKFIIFLIIIIIWLISQNKTTTTGNKDADYQLENQENENRPESGEIEFNNEKTNNEK